MTPTDLISKIQYNEGEIYRLEYRIWFLSDAFKFYIDADYKRIKKLREANKEYEELCKEVSELYIDLWYAENINWEDY